MKCIITFQGKEYTYDQWIKLLHDGKLDELVSEGVLNIAPYKAPMETKQKEASEKIAAAEAQVDLNPTEAQKEAGNYPKGHVSIQGLPVTIETPKGANRTGVDSNGKKWSITMKNSYGYIKRTEGADGENVDVFLGPNPESQTVYVIDQVVDGKFDEHKVMIGFSSAEEASKAYLSNYTKGWKGLGEITEMTMAEFKDWLQENSQQPVAFRTEKEKQQDAVNDLIIDKDRYNKMTQKQKAIAGSLLSSIQSQAKALGIDVIPLKQRKIDLRDKKTGKKITKRGVVRARDYVEHTKNLREARKWVSGGNQDFPPSTDDVVLYLILSGTTVSSDYAPTEPGTTEFVRLQNSKIISEKGLPADKISERVSQILPGAKADDGTNYRDMIEEILRSYGTKAEMEKALVDRYLTVTSQTKEKTKEREISDYVLRAVKEKTEQIESLKKKINEIQKAKEKKKKEISGRIAKDQADLFGEKESTEGELFDDTAVDQSKENIQRILSEYDNEIQLIEEEIEFLESQIEKLETYDEKQVQIVFEQDEEIETQKEKETEEETKPKENFFDDDDYEYSEPTGEDAPFTRTGDSKASEGKRKNKRKSQQQKDREFSNQVFADTGLPSGTLDGTIKPMDFPEIVRLVIELLGSNNVKVRKLRGALGVFYSGKKMIAIAPELFEPGKEQQLAKTLAHEIGHLVDFLSSLGNTLERGNILGRIASLKQYMQKYLPFEEGAQGPITKAEKDAMRRRAKKNNPDVKITREEEEFIEKVESLTPEQIMSIWNDTESRSKYPELYEFIQMLPARDKKKVVVDAMKGMVSHPGLKAMAVKSKVPTGRTVTIVEVIKGNWKPEFQQALEDEIRARKLWVSNKIFEETFALSKKWRPMNGTSQSYIDYRKSSVEIYADMISILLNDPGMLEREAPMFFQAFKNYLNRKPEFRDAWQDIQNVLQDPARIIEARIAWDTRGFDQAAENNKNMAIREKSEGWWGNFLRHFVSEFYAIYNKIPSNHPFSKTFGRILSKKEKLRNALESIRMWQARQTAIVSDYKTAVVDVLDAAGIDVDDFGIILQRTRNMQRDKIANPGGMQGEDVNQQDVDYILSKYTDEQRKMLRLAQVNFYNITWNSVKTAYKAGMITYEYYKELQKNKYGYATFQAVDKMNGDLISGGFMKTTGSFSQTANPLFSTIVKAVMVDFQAVKNIAKRKAVDAAFQAFPEEVYVVGVDERGNPFPFDSDEFKVKNYGVVKLKQQGRTIAAYTDRTVADIFNNEPAENVEIVSALLTATTSFMRDMVTKFNLGFAAITNPLRDFYSSMVYYNTIVQSKSNNRSYLNYIKSPAKFAFRMITNLPEAWKTAWKKDSKLTNEMMRKGVFNPTSGIYDSYDSRYSQRYNAFRHYKFMQRYFPVADREKSFSGTVALVYDLITIAWDYTIGNNIAKPLELASKMAGYTLLKEDLGNAEAAAFFARNAIGTPNFTESALLKFLRYIPFYSVIVQALRVEVETARNPETRSAYIVSTLLYAGVPSMVYAAMKAGLFDDEEDKEEDKLSTRMSNLGSYALYNSYAIPTFTRGPDGAEGYIPIPLKPGLSTVMHSLIMDAVTDISVAEKVKMTTLAVKNVFPAPEIPIMSSVSKWSQYYFLDKNPVDDFTGRDIMSNDVFQAGGRKALKALVLHTLGEFGIRIATNPDRPMTGRDLVLSNSLVRRLYRESSRGMTEKFREADKKIKKEGSVLKLEIMDKVQERIERDEELLLQLSNIQDAKTWSISLAIADQWAMEISDEIINKPESEYAEEDFKTYDRIRKTVEIAVNKNMFAHSTFLRNVLFASSAELQREYLKIYQGMVDKETYDEVLFLGVSYELFSKDVQNEILFENPSLQKKIDDFMRQVQIHMDQKNKTK